ncbi:MAG: hypothetical protein B6242_16980 [Anaerolineaceae bacterium 4572_78]|nr:MAG: hypothetical protein B6242_16980 [Anaerolineaceae bacterium 4572_78]
MEPGESIVPGTTTLKGLNVKRSNSLREIIAPGSIWGTNRPRHHNPEVNSPRYSYSPGAIHIQPFQGWRIPPGAIHIQPFQGWRIPPHFSIHIQPFQGWRIPPHFSIHIQPFQGWRIPPHFSVSLLLTTTITPITE